MDKAQIPGNVLMIVAGVVILAVILVFAYRGILGMTKGSDAAMRTQTEQALLQDLSSGMARGAVKDVSYPWPYGVDRICFVDLAKVKAADIADEPLIQSSVASGVQENVFFLGNSLFEGFDAPHLALSSPPYYFCTGPTASGLSLAMRGTGAATLVGVPPDKATCQLAVSKGWCPVIDLPYGYGYRAGCCSDYGLCC